MRHADLEVRRAQEGRLGRSWFRGQAHRGMEEKKRSNMLKFGEEIGVVVDIDGGGV